MFLYIHEISLLLLHSFFLCIFSTSSQDQGICFKVKKTQHIVVMLSVGIWGAAGYMGSSFSRALLKAHRSGLVRFVILHRPESDLRRYPADIEKRLIDLDGGQMASIVEKVSDLQVVMCVSSSSRYSCVVAFDVLIVYLFLFNFSYKCAHSNSSAVSWRAHESQYRLIDALKGSEQLVTFFPSEYATPQSAEDLTSQYFANTREKEKLRAYCTTHGVPFTVLANATTPELLFNFT